MRLDRRLGRRHRAVNPFREAVSGPAGGAASETAAWHEMLTWLQADHTLAAFLERVFQALDATRWLLAAALNELNDAASYRGTGRKRKRRA